ncbi:hypothetical protein BDV59DRAFT_184272 [Aspergillus ambiguus]|uniref:uncharacterized protein n=1 Tax=Aspergillus ambiguus TaxID=176160 RepID=UPI003CCD9FD3
MAGPLSIPAGVAGFSSLGIQVSEYLFKYYISYRGQGVEIARTADRLDSLLHIFRSIDKAISGRSDEDLTRNVHSSIDNALQLGEQKRTHDNLVEIKSLLQCIQANQLSSDVRNWLKAPDVTVNHNSARSKHHPGTGDWLIHDSRFITWTTQANSFLWLNGFAGCGKSVLCSTIIHHIFNQQQHQTNIGIAFFLLYVYGQHKERCLRNDTDPAATIISSESRMPDRSGTPLRLIQIWNAA